jgi:hypothetical protein
MRQRLFAKLIALCLSVVTFTAVAGPLATESAHALTGPWTQSTVTVHQTPHVICRAYGGSISANTEADQDLGFTVKYPDGVHQGDTFDIKIRPDVSLYPRTDASSGVTATINNIYDQVSGYQLPAGLTINSVTLGPINGNMEANADAGYYVDRANVPHSNVSGVGDIPDPNFDPMTLPPAQRLAIPGTTPNAFWNTTTNRVYESAVGTHAGGSSQEYKGGSALQQPTITINVTATAAAGTNLQTKLAGILPAGSFTGGQPNNFPAPSSSASLTSVAASAPWSSTNGSRWAYSDSVWTDPTYLNTVDTTALGGIIHVTAKAACAPGWEATGTYPSAPAYYTGANAIPNGQSPALTSTMVVQDVDTQPPAITVSSPIDGAKYVSEQSPVVASFDCNDTFGSGDDICTGDVDNGQSVDWSPGTHTFTVNAQDLAGNPTSKSVTYTVAANQNPVANHGPDQVGKRTGNTVTLDASGSTDPDGPPAQSLTYTWTQTGGAPVTLSDIHAVKPTFVVPANPAFVYPHAITFSVTVDDPYGGTNTTADSVSVQVVATTPTVTAVTRSPSGTVFTGDLVTLGATVTNPDGGALTYAWSQATGRTTSLSSTTSANPTFNVPSSGANPTAAACTSGTGATSPTSANCPRFQVSVTAAQTSGGTSAGVALAAYASSLPARPVANAGPAQTVATGGGNVTLDGSGSTQAQSHALSYSWTQTAGPAVTLSSSTAQKPTFTAAPSGASAVTYTFSLTVVDTQSPIAGTGTNGNTSAAATVNITVVPDHVVANAGPNQTGKVAGNVITLDASGSTEPQLQPLSYTWSQVSNGAPTVTLSNPNIVNPTFTAPPASAPGGYTAAFNVTATNGGPNPGDTDTTVTPVTITVAASTPTVVQTQSRAGGGGTFFTGDLMTLNAAITNPDGATPGDYTYAWSQVSGRTTTLSSTTAANPTFTLPSSGANPTGAACTSGSGSVSATSANCPRFQVVVTKTNTGKVSTAATLANYGSSLPTRPVANAGAAQNVKVGSGTITLDGSTSAQAQGHAIGYTWSQTAGPAVSLSDPTAQKPTFAAPNTPAAYTFSLTVKDAQSPITGTGTNGNTSLAATVTISVSNYASPIANAGSNQSLSVASPVMLDASGSSQADGHTLTYAWTQTAGTPVSLSDATAVNPTFTAPIAGTILKFTVTVTDTQNPNPAAASTTSSAVTISVGDYSPPVADAGLDQVVHVRDAAVTLDATGSGQPNGHEITYHWTQTAGTAVALSDPDSPQPTFTAPASSGSLTFTVTVTDTENPNPDTNTATAAVQIDVHDYAAPTANAGPNQTGIDIGTTVTLDASASSQEDGHALTYLWTQVAGPTVTLSDATAQKPTFIAPTGPLTLEFSLVADDTFNVSAPSTVFVDVNGIHGLDLAANLSGDVTGEKAASTFTVNVVNDGVLKETVTQANVGVTITRNSVTVPSAQYTLTAKSVVLASHKATNFALKWNHGDTLHAGDNIVIRTCVNYVGDENPANNCSTKNDPRGAISVFAWPKPDDTVRSSQTSTAIPVWVTNISGFIVRPIRVEENVSVTVSVNGGPAQPTTAVQKAPLALGGNQGTVGATFTWAHPKYAKGTPVVITACAVIPGNTAVPTCWSKTLHVTV